jgi:16S rRNA (uracil1498-N3)-methyltransferase
MRVSRIYLQEPLIPAARLALPTQAAHYVGRVLRLSAGDELLLFNGDGRDYPARILDVDKRGVTVMVETALAVSTESSLQCTLGLGISRGDRMDYAVQKSTELGVTDIVPLFTAHGEVRLSGERAEKRRQHWQQVAISACEQCGRASIPRVHALQTLDQWLAGLQGGTRLIFDGHQQQSLTASRPEDPVSLLIGPEGGFSREEVALANARGFISVRLGPRVLRTETAPVVALSVLQYLWGDLG